MNPAAAKIGNRETGFSLLEVLVAFSILALSLGVLMQIYASGSRNTLRGADYSRAAELAESVLAQAGTEHPLAPAVHNGEQAGMYWQLAIVPVAPTGMVAPPPFLTSFQVTAQVGWGELGREHSLQLDTLRLGKSERER